MERAFLVAIFCKPLRPVVTDILHRPLFAGDVDRGEIRRLSVAIRKRTFGRADALCDHVWRSRDHRRQSISLTGNTPRSRVEGGGTFGRTRFRFGFKFGLQPGGFFGGDGDALQLPRRIDAAFIILDMPGRMPVEIPDIPTGLPTALLTLDRDAMRLAVHNRVLPGWIKAEVTHCTREGRPDIGFR